MKSFFIQVVHVPAYISTIISAADEGPDDITCFPAGLHFLYFSQQDCQKYHGNRCVFKQTFPRKYVLIYPEIHRHICELFQKGEFMDSVEPRGNTISLSGNNMELSACFANVSF